MRGLVMPASLPVACLISAPNATAGGLPDAVHEGYEEEAGDEGDAHEEEDAATQLGESGAQAHEGQAHASRQGPVERGDLVTHVEVDADDGGDVQQEDSPPGTGEDSTGDEQVEESAAQGGDAGTLPGIGQHGAHSAQHGAVGGRRRRRPECRADNRRPRRPRRELRGCSGPPGSRGRQSRPQRQRRWASSCG